MLQIPVVVIANKEYGLARFLVMEGSVDLPHRLGQTQAFEALWVAPLHGVAIQRPHLSACIHQNRTTYISNSKT